MLTSQVFGGAYYMCVNGIYGQLYEHLNVPQHVQDVTIKGRGQSHKARIPRCQPYSQHNEEPSHLNISTP